MPTRRRTDATGFSRGVLAPPVVPRLLVYPLGQLGGLTAPRVRSEWGICIDDVAGQGFAPTWEEARLAVLALIGPVVAGLGPGPPLTGAWDPKSLTWKP